MFVFVCLFVCPPRYDARHRKPRWCVYVLNLGGTGIGTPRVVIVLVLVIQQAATYSIAAIAGN